MIMDRVISHLRNSGFTVYKAGNNSDIERKPLRRHRHGRVYSALDAFARQGIYAFHDSDQ